MASVNSFETDMRKLRKKRKRKRALKNLMMMLIVGCHTSKECLGAE